MRVDIGPCLLFLTWANCGGSYSKKGNKWRKEAVEEDKKEGMESYSNKGAIIVAN